MRGDVTSTHTLGHGKANHGQALKGGVASLPEQACLVLRVCIMLLIIRP